MFAVVVPVLVGYLSDRTSTRFGRRRPWIAVGTIFNLFGLGLLAGAGSVPALIAAYLVVQISNNGAFAAYSAVIPDVVPVHQNGRASGLLNAMQQLGTVVGLFALTILLKPGSPWQHPCRRSRRPGCGRYLHRRLGHHLAGCDP